MPTASPWPTGRCSGRTTTFRCPASLPPTASSIRRSAPRSTRASSGCAPRPTDEYVSALAQSTDHGGAVLQEVALGNKSLADYTHLAGRGLVDEIRELDVIIVHDPQPVGMRHNALDHAKNWIWRCHIDLSEPNPEPIARLLPLISEYDITVWHLEQYVPKGLDGHGGVRIVPPAIDPLSPKNMALSPDDAAFVCNQFGIDVDRPMICQVSRFDPWKDPIGVIDAYRQVTKEIPEVQLALVGSMATDDPEGWEFFHRTFEYAGSDPDIKILNNLNNVGAIEVNAFQSQADVVLQKSIREGFGLTVSEALWKGRPTIAGDVGGIPLQIVDGEDGYLVSSPAQAAERCTGILQDPELGRRLGRAGKERTRERFLSPRLLLDWVRIFTSLDT